ncbi:MAG: dihydrofolate reductase [Planctomycetota bacterium]
MNIIIIAALASNRVIGRDGKIPWRLPEDLRRFKRLTTGHAVVMGRKTWESIGKPLPDRRNIVISRRADFPLPQGVHRAENFEAALNLCRAAAETNVFVIGGAEVYRAALPLADEMHLTCLDRAVEGDVVFPEWNPAEWRETGREAFEGGSYRVYMKA